MRCCLLILALFATATQTYAAPKVSFPYDATVEADETLVRSGPGSKYYPTMKLKRGQRVVVHRHDPGGWHVIAPPAGSYSWVPARYVERTKDDRGTINTNSVVAYVGSFESDIREVFQAMLAEGDEVQILGEKQLPAMPKKNGQTEQKGGPLELWYRIAPPRGEWRWIAGQALSPAPRDGGKVAEDPFDRPIDVGSRGRAAPVTDENRFEKPVTPTDSRDYLDGDAASTDSGAIADRPIVRRQASGTPAKPSKQTTSKHLDAQLDELDRLDARFRSILDKDPLEWDFSQLESDYRGLRAEIDSSNVQQMIDVRLARMSGYRKIRGEHEEAARIAEETLRRDAELAEVARQQEAQLAALKQARFDGAGILQRAALRRKGAPQYALLAPTGKVLAYLVGAPGVNLEGWVGRSVGVTGSRVPSPELKTDLITVVRLTPVKLSQ